MTQQHKRLATSALVVAVATVGLVSNLLAANVTLNVTGDYLGPNWNSVGNVPPGALDTGFINSGRTATLAGLAPTVGLAMNIGSSTGPSRGTLVLNSGADLAVTGTTTVYSYGLLGSGNSGVVSQNSGSSFAVTTLNIGTGLASGQTPANTDAALYTINGGTLTASTAIVVPVNSARGHLVVNGGTVNTPTLTIGNNGGAGEMTIAGGDVTVSGVLTLNAAGATNLGTSIISVSAGSLTLNTGSTVSMSNTLHSINPKSISVSGTGVVNLGGRNTSWANNGATQEYGVVTVAGGELNFQNANVQLGNSSSFTGGKVTGVAIVTSNAMTVNGAEFHVGSITATASTTTLSNVAGLAFALQSGQMVFGAYGNNSADLFVKSGLATADLTGGTIVVDLKYSPLAGDSYNLVDWTGAGMTLSAANLSPTSYDGLWQIEWDASQWESAGILTIVSAKIPEPASFSLLALAGLASLRRRR